MFSCAKESVLSGHFGVKPFYNKTVYLHFNGFNGFLHYPQCRLTDSCASGNSSPPKETDAAAQLSFGATILDL